MPTKVCSHCHIDKRTTSFYANKTTKTGLSSWCKACVKNTPYNRNEGARKKYLCAYNKEHQEKNREYQKLWYATNKTHIQRVVREREARLKLFVLTHYSKGIVQCARCGITDIDVLTIDHLNDEGAQHRKLLKTLGDTLYQWLKRNEFPEGYQVLCFNCNFKKGLVKNRESKGKE